MEKNFYIEELEKYATSLEKNGIKSIINLSDWNPSKDFMNKLAIDIPYTFIDNPISYIFSSDFNYDIKINILEKWNCSTEKTIVFFNTGSESILNTLYFLARERCNKIYLLCPTYFSIEPICKTLDIKCIKVYLVRENDSYSFPDNLEKIVDKNSCLWITNPIYCTGTLYSAKDINKLKELVFQRKIFLVNDESLCFKHFSLNSVFEYYEKYINIITPHKALCTNALKFSGIILSKKYYDSIDKWSDILEGCLGIGVKAAVNHFLSTEFDKYTKSFTKSIEENRQKIINILDKYGIDYDLHSVSYLMSVYFPNIPYNYLDNMDQMKKLISATNAFVITGSKNSFPINVGLSFRINLCRIDNQYLYALERVVRYLQNPL